MTRLKPGSQNHRIVQALKENGGWMTTAELHEVAGFSRLNSRVAELRDLGYTIPTRHVPGQTGVHATEYLLVGTPDEVGVGTDGLSPSASASSGASTDDPSPESARSLTAAGVPSFEQLRLVA